AGERVVHVRQVGRRRGWGRRCTLHRLLLRLPRVLVLLRGRRQRDREAAQPVVGGNLVDRLLEHSLLLGLLAPGGVRHVAEERLVLQLHAGGLGAVLLGGRAFLLRPGRAEADDDHAATRAGARALDTHLSGI